jgi:aldehyde dehydrogenase
MELIGDLLPQEYHIVNGFVKELWYKTKKVSKAAFTGSTPTGRLVYATEKHYSSNIRIRW